MKSSFISLTFCFLAARLAFGADLAASIRPEDLLPPAPVWQGKSERLIARGDDPWITPAEQANFTATPTYGETRAWLGKLAAATNLIRIETFGTSPQGRDLYVVIATKDPGALDPVKPVVLVQAGIHSGEIDGKDAGLMLLRDIAFHGKAALLDRVNLMFVPIFSVDAHERASAFNRPNQRGPANQGWRTTAQNLNINRDYTKLDAPETQAMVGLIRKYQPDLSIDVHVTDGSDYQYDVTFGFMGWNGSYAMSPRIGGWMDKIYRPALERGLKAAGHIPGGLIFAADDRDPTKGLVNTVYTPRFSHAYGDAIHMASVLVENHSLKPYRRRVLGTYVLLEETLKTLAQRGHDLRLATAADRGARPARVPVQWANTDKVAAKRDFLPMAFELFQSPASGRSEIRWLGKPAKALKVDEYGAESKVSLQRPSAYWVPATKSDVIARLRLHGIKMESLTAARIVEVDMLRLTQSKLAARPSEGHTPIASGTPTHETRREIFPIGSVRVPTDQPLGDLAMILLEPESDDSFFAWGFFPEILQRTEYIEGYVLAPLAERMLAADSMLKKEFEDKLAAEPTFAADANARLAWLYERTPYYDERYLLYPVGREVAR